MLCDWVLDKADWTVERFILISGIISKAYNLGWEILALLKGSISGLEFGERTNGLFLEALLPYKNQMSFRVENMEASFYKQKGSTSPKVTRIERAEQFLEDFDDRQEMGRTNCFHRIYTDGVSPIVQNLLMPLGMSSDQSQCYRRCPFPVADLNHRTRNENLEMDILDNLFHPNPPYLMSELYMVMGVSKILPDSISDAKKEEYLIKMKNCRADIVNRSLIGQDPPPPGDRDEEPQKDAFRSYPLMSELYDQETKNLFRTINYVAVSKDAIGTMRGYGELKNDKLVPFHYSLIAFKSKVENQLRTYMRRDLENYEENHPVHNIQRLARKMRSAGGDSLRPFFRGCLETQFIIDWEKTSQKVLLPFFVHICKVLLQGRSSIVEQSLEGNHRLGILAALLSGSLSSAMLQRIKPESKLNLSLLFGGASIVQATPKVKSETSQTNKKVGRQVKNICGSPAKSLWLTVFLFIYTHCF